MPTFGFDSTTDDVLSGVDLPGTEVVITGASTGLGLETARALAAHGATVIGIVRDVDRARAALDDVGATGVELYQADLASLESVRAVTDAFVADGHDRIDVLIANAGIMGCPQATTADGFEMQFGTNHLGHFVLVNRLLPLMVDGDPARVVMLSSAGHRFGDVSLDDPGFEQSPYDEWVAYGRAKTANALFAVELDRRLRERGVRATSVHPGGIVTELGRHLTEESIGALLEARGERELVWKSVPQGASTSVWAGFVADADEVGGRYCEDCSVSPVVDDPDQSPGVMRYAVSPETASSAVGPVRADGRRVVRRLNGSGGGAAPRRTAHERSIGLHSDRLHPPSTNDPSTAMGVSIISDSTAGSSETAVSSRPNRQRRNATVA